MTLGAEVVRPLSHSSSSPLPTNPRPSTIDPNPDRPGAAHTFGSDPRAKYAANTRRHRSNLRWCAIRESCNWRESWKRLSRELAFARSSQNRAEPDGRIDVPLRAPSRRHVATVRSSDARAARIGRTKLSAAIPVKSASSTTATMSSINVNPVDDFDGRALIAWPVGSPGVRYPSW